MNDLVRMLSEQNLGVNLASDIIADDIVLMGKSEQELQTLLNITARFASKWNLKFNFKKSKLMGISKKIEETNVYKYLGVYFSRSLYITYHIETFIKENVQKKLNYMIRILGEHGKFNRISFEDSLWTSIIRPSIAHDCAVWFPSAISSAQNIESVQYQAGKIILKTKMSFPESALLSEFEYYCYILLFLLFLLLDCIVCIHYTLYPYT